jgi:hypothetical protein
MEYEQLERFSGFTLLSLPVFESAVFALDNCARLELLVRLHDVLPAFLLNPVLMFLCLCVGIVLLDKSYKQRMPVSRYDVETHSFGKPRIQRTD